MEDLLFKPGDVIQDFCEPFMKVLYSTQKGSRCDFCFELSTTIRRCTSCKQVFYCSKSCQILDWKVAHKVECSLTYFRSNESDSLFSPATLDFKYRLLRLFSILKLHPQLAEKLYPIYDGSTRSFNELMSHHEQVEQIPESRKYCAEMAKSLLEEESLGLNSTDTDPFFQYFLHLSGIFKTNAFCIYTPDKTEKIGAGLYIQTSIFDHSCRPTAFFLMKESSIQIRAIAPIKKGERPLISYLLAHKGRAQRRRELRERYNFHCLCQRCVEEEDKEGELDFDRLNQLLQSSSTFEPTTDWTHVHTTHMEIIKAFRLMYNEYDERITNQMFWAFTKLKEISEQRGTNPALQATLSEISSETKIHLLITYGSDHDYFHQFQQLEN